MLYLKKLSSAVAFWLSVFSLTGCTSLQVVDQMLEFNRGVEIATNKMMLLNAVRASKRHPMYFSDITQSIATPKYEGDVSFDLPFGGAASQLFSATPSVGVSKQNSMTLVPLNKQSFYNGILSPVNFQNVGQYIHQGWPVNILLNMLVEKIYMSVDRAKFLFERAVYACEEGNRKSNAACDQFENSLCDVASIAVHVCHDQPSRHVSEVINRNLVVKNGEIRNDPEDIHDFPLFRSVVSALWVLDFDVVPTSGLQKFSTVSKTVERRTGPGGKTVYTTVTEETKPGAKDELTLLTRIPQSYRHVGHRQIARYCRIRSDAVPTGMCGVKMHASRKRTGNLELGGVMRSPQGMLFYLGELIKVQSSGRADHQALQTIAAQIFPVHIGRLSNAAVSVRYNGATYSIRDDERGRSAMQLFALVNQLINLKKASKELPTVPTVIAVGG